MALRIPVALLVGLAVAASLGTAFAATTDAGGATFHVPQARIGDRASYQVALDGDWRFDDHAPSVPFPLLDLEWSPAEDVRYGSGALGPADVLHIQGATYAPWRYGLDDAAEPVLLPAWRDDHQTVWFEPGTTRIVTLATTDDESVSWPTLGAETSPLVRSSVHATRETRWYPDGASWSHCLAADAVQGQALRVGDTVEMPDCVIANLGHWRPAGRFTATAAEPVEGVEAIRLEGDGATMWWAAGLAYPLRYAAIQEVATVDDGGSRTYGIGSFVVSLVGVTLGASDRAALDAPVPLPSLETAAPAAWGMDETGLEHPFPLSAAYAAALERSPLMGDLLERSPGAYLALADEGPRVYDSDEAHSWRFTVTDGTEAIELVVVQRTNHTPVLGTALPAPMPWVQGAPAAVGTTTVSVSEEPLELDAPWPRRGQLPAEWPSLAGLADRWRLYTTGGADGLPVTTWGHRLTCTDEACVNPVLDVWVGGRAVEVEPAALDPGGAAPVIVQPETRRESGLWFNASSQQAWLFAESHDVADAYGLDPSGGASSPSEAAQGPGRGGWLAGLWTPAQAAGVGAVAALAALLYWLWPVLKPGGLVGLFSRLDPGQLLEHPRRARILDAVAAEPGIHFSELLRRTGVGNGSLHHHLQVLRDAGRLQAVAAQGYTCYFPAGAGASVAQGASAAKADGAQRILGHVRAHPGLSVKQIAAECGLHPSTVTYHVQRLTEAGLVDALRDGREVRLHGRTPA